MSDDAFDGMIFRSDVEIDEGYVSILGDDLVCIVRGSGIAQSKMEGVLFPGGDRGETKVLGIYLSTSNKFKLTTIKTP